ncbi:MAG: hypothetical protein HYY17_17245 [Planctomycetes bacterium]|nr:hypothetical protein [Planctomycetota bacterium]
MMHAGRRLVVTVAAFLGMAGGAAAQATAWQPTASLPDARQGHASATYNGYVYVLGGSKAVGPAFQHFDTVFYAKVQQDGSLGAWLTAAPLRKEVSYASCVAHGGRLYLIGGMNNSATGGVRDVDVAVINPDGSTSAWFLAATLPLYEQRHDAAAAACGGRLYVIGGSTGGAFFDSVLVSTLDANGIPGPFGSTTALGIGRYGHTAIARQGRLFVFGGTANGSDATVRSAPVNADGTVGTWAAASSFAGSRAHHGSAVGGGRIYVVGGNSQESSAIHAAFAGDGTLHEWAEWTPVPAGQGRERHALAASGNHLYAIGGSVAGSASAGVLYVRMAEPPGEVPPGNGILPTESYGAGRACGGSVAGATSRPLLLAILLLAAALLARPIHEGFRRPAENS